MTWSSEFSCLFWNSEARKVHECSEINAEPAAALVSACLTLVNPARPGNLPISRNDQRRTREIHRQYKRVAECLQRRSCRMGFYLCSLFNPISQASSRCHRGNTSRIISERSAREAVVAGLPIVRVDRTYTSRVQY